MEIKTKVGNLDLIESGSIVLNQDSKLSFSVEDLEFEFAFQTEEGKEQKPHIELMTSNPKKIVFQLINYNNPLGTGMPNPLNIASLSSGEDIYLQFAVHGINELKIFHYTFYSKSKNVVDAVDEGRVEQKNDE